MMAKYNDPVHPNAIAARMNLRAQHLAKDKAASRQREKDILALVEDRMSYRQIGRAFAISGGRVGQIVRRAKRRARS